MQTAVNHYAGGPEALLVSLAAKGDKDAFAELVRRRQSWIRSLMRRCCGDTDLADDLSQQIFLQAWRKIRQVKDPRKFGSWLKTLAINEWMQRQRKHDPLWKAEDHEEARLSHQESPAVALDLDKALATLPGQVRLCVILSYHERMSHAEIAELSGLQLGTVKSHIRRGSKSLREMLSAYGGSV